MRFVLKIALSVTCVALIAGATVFVLAHRRTIEHQRQEAQAYRLRAEQGDRDAQFALAGMYRKGAGVSQSYSEALKWYRKAADQNLAKAQYDVGYAYYYGYGVDGDFAEALRWFHLAADQKDPVAENEIGIAYEVGNGVERDFGQALHWYRLSADQGLAAGQYNVGRMYAFGDGVGRDRAVAREWITKAADQGYLPAKQMLGRSWPALKTFQKIQLTCCLAAGIMLLIPSNIRRPELRFRATALARMGGVFLLFSVVLSLLSYSYGGALHPPALAESLSFARNAFGGTILSLLLRMIWSNSPKRVLWTAGSLFIAFNALAVAHHDRFRIDAAVRLLISVNGSLLGLGVTSAVLLRAQRNAGNGHSIDPIAP